MHSIDPAKEKKPDGQAISEVDPNGQAFPAEQVLQDKAPAALKDPG